MAKKLKISVLTDKTSWMNKYNLILSDGIRKLNHEVELIHSKDELQNGDIAFFLSCFEIVGSKYLQLNKNNIVVHASNLPQGKGWSPATWQILEDKNNIPLTLFEASDSVDAGDYYIKDTLELDGSELIDDWQEKLGKKIVQMCLNFIEDYENIKPIPQKGEESFYRRRTPKDSELDINKTIKDQFNLLRVVDNEKYPAYFKYNSEVYVIKIAKMSSAKDAVTSWGGGNFKRILPRGSLSPRLIFEIASLYIFNLKRVPTLLFVCLKSGQRMQYA